MTYEVEITDQFNDWWVSLPEEQQEALAARVDLLEREGPAMRRPYSGEIKTSEFDPRMKELICDVGGTRIRVLYIFDQRQVAILLLGGDKAGKWISWYEQNIPVADQLYRDHIKQITDEGLV